MHQPWSGLIANIAFYMPLGLFCTAAQERACPAWQQAMWTTAIGMLLSLSMRSAPVLRHRSHHTLTGVYPDVISCSVGTATNTLGRSSDKHEHARAPERCPALLLLPFLVYRLFPYVLTLDLNAYWQALKSVVLHPPVHGFDVSSHAVIWTVVAALFADLVIR
jgi:hypothetical protein